MKKPDFTAFIRLMRPRSWGLALIALATALIMSYLVRGGYTPAATAEFNPPPSCPAIASKPIWPDCRSSQMHRSVAAVWRALEGDIRREPDSPEAHIASIVGLLAMPGVPDEMFDTGLDSFKAKSDAFLKDADIKEMDAAFRSTDSAKRLSALRRLHQADADAAAVIGCLLQDEARFRRYVANNHYKPEE